MDYKINTYQVITSKGEKTVEAVTSSRTIQELISFRIQQLHNRNDFEFFYLEANTVSLLLECDKNSSCTKLTVKVFDKKSSNNSVNNLIILAIFNGKDSIDYLKPICERFYQECKVLTLPIGNKAYTTVVFFGGDVSQLNFCCSSCSLFTLFTLWYPHT